MEAMPDFLQTSTDLVSRNTIYFKQEAENGTPVHFFQVLPRQDGIVDVRSVGPRLVKFKRKVWQHLKPESLHILARHAITKPPSKFIITIISVCFLFILKCLTPPRSFRA
jgi:hypothetical protein